MKGASSKSINFFSYFLLASLVILIFNFCAEKKPTEPSTSQNKSLSVIGTGNSGLSLSVTGDSTKTKDKDKDKDKKKDGGGIGPYAQSQCQKVVYYWIFDHYETVSGKIWGILPEDDTFWQNTYKLHTFKDTLGFNYICTIEGYLNTVLSAGYDRDHIMIGGMGCDDPYWQQTIQATKPVWAYYVDEQGQQHSCSVVEYWFSSVRQYLNNNGGSSIKIIAGETTPEDFDCYDQYVNTIMCTWYGYYVWPLTNDQRSRWTDFRTAWNSKFNLTWVSSRLDNTEFDNLIGHASNLGLDGVWLYQEDDGQASEATERSRINNFSFYGWKWGYLNRIERKWVYMYECENQDPCDCDPYTLGSEWIVVDKYPTYETRVRTY